ncbi:AMP-binding protein [Nocardioides agariphilus]|uniref:AMP-binding protein n=1 Tax=Nocardioides agariphilus TaxID=433664 RepID=A0A930VND5_9ACTN|nr:AMP-binding protein [Nocardioides agariphilus]MBF4769953.1 AMP-binding protein [Nocardioides agariphilus]
MESYAMGETDRALLEETIGANLERTVAAHPDREALVEVATGRRWTWAELDAAVDDLAIGLLRAGITKGDRVGIWSPNCAEWTITQFATAKIGAILVNINPAYRTHELAYALRQSGTRLLVSATEFKTSDYRAMVEEVRGEVDLEMVWFLGSPEWTDHNVHDPGVTLVQLLAELGEDLLRPDDPINIQYTSGTTGYPKGATLSHRNILNNGYFVTETINFTHEDRLCIPVPFYHCFGMVMGNLGCSTHGATMVIPGPGFDPETTLRTIAQERCTGVYGVPTMFIAMQNDPTFAEHDLSSLRTGIMAGSICPVEVMKHCIADMHMEEVSIAYGMTETSPVSCQTRADDDLDRRTATIGRAHPHVEIKIVDPQTGATVERGQTGEFCTRGYSVMLGYWKEPDKTGEAIDAEGWMHTGDLAEMREDGYCNIVGRIKDMVIRGGENVYPREIEEFLYTHPDIEDVQVIGVPDQKYGEELAAWVKLRAGAEPLDADAVRAFATGKLAHYKIPRYVLLVDEFPMTVTGKIRKVQMREETAAQLGLA